MSISADTTVLVLVAPSKIESEILQILSSPYVSICSFSEFAWDLEVHVHLDSNKAEFQKHLLTVSSVQISIGLGLCVDLQCNTMKR